MKTVLQIRPYKADDLTEVLDLLNPQEDGFWLLQGLLTSESTTELHSLLGKIDRGTITTAQDYWFDDAYGLSLIFVQDESVEIRHTYVEDFVFTLKNSNLTKIIKAILDYRNDKLPKTIKLILSDREGPKAIDKL